MAVLMYFIHLISMKQKLGWTEQGFGDLSYKSLFCIITNRNCIQFRICCKLWKAI